MSMALRTLVVLLLGTGLAAATERREFDFDVTLDGRPIGSHRYELIPSGPGSYEVDSRASFDFNLLGVPLYRYRHQALERITNDCLERIEALTRDNGESLSVRGARSDDGFLLETPAGKPQSRDCVMGYAYWDLELLLRRRELLNPQTGEFDEVSVEFAGKRVGAAEGRAGAGERYRLHAARNGHRPVVLAAWRLAAAGEPTVRGGCIYRCARCREPGVLTRVQATSPRTARRSLRPSRGSGRRHGRAPPVGPGTARVPCRRFRDSARHRNDRRARRCGRAGPPGCRVRSRAPETPASSPSRSIVSSTGPLRARVSQRIADQVLQHQLDARRVQPRVRLAGDRSAAAARARRTAAAAIRASSGSGPRSGRRAVWAEPSRSASSSILDDAAHLRGILPQRADCRGVLQQRQAQRDPRDRRAQLVADTQQQLPLRVQHAFDLARHAVDVFGQLTQFVVALRADAMVEMSGTDVGRPLPDRRDGPEQPAHGEVGAQHQQQCEPDQYRNQRWTGALVGDLRRGDDDLVAALDELMKRGRPLTANPLLPARRAVRRAPR